MLYGYTVYLLILLANGVLMTKPSFAQYLLQSRSHPVLAQKSAFELYKSYQRLALRSRWPASLCIWRRSSTNYS